MTTPSTLGWIVPAPEMERAPRVREDALCDCPWCGQGARACGYSMASKKGGANSGPAPPPAPAAARCAAGHPYRYADSRQTDLFPQGTLSCRSATGGGRGALFRRPHIPWRTASPLVIDVLGSGIASQARK